jgi:type IV pilus assembly protein PilC
MSKFSLQEQALFARRLSLLMRANISLIQAMNMLEGQAASRAHQKMLNRVSQDIANGQFLSKSLARSKGIFGSFGINIINIGETSGTLSQNLHYLADELDKQQKLRQKIVGALIYPAIIFLAALALSAFMTMYLFPKLIPVFKSLNVELPFLTRFMISLSNFLINNWLMLLLSILGTLIVSIFLLRIPNIKFLANKASLKIPIIGPMLKHYYLINICRTLGILFKSQVPVLEAVTVTAGTSPNLVYKKELLKLNRAIAKGSNLATHLEKNTSVFPKLLSQMIAVGETTGNLSDTLLYLGEMYEQELDEQTKRLSSLLEPVMMIGMGLLVGLVAISIITPIYEVTQHITPR